VAAARASPGHRATAHRQDHGQGHRSGPTKTIFKSFYFEKTP
jgi:hypothetical protein